MNVNNYPVPLPPGGVADRYKSPDADGVNTSGVNTGAVGGPHQTARAAAAAAGTSSSTGGSNANDDVHLSELVRTLRSLAADSPERQARIEHLARSYASGNYQADPQATADGLINDNFSDALSQTAH